MKDSKEMGMESDIKSRMQPLKEQLKEMINQLNKVFESQLFISICRGFWERMGQVISKMPSKNKTVNPSG